MKAKSSVALAVWTKASVCLYDCYGATKTDPRSNPLAPYEKESLFWNTTELWINRSSRLLIELLSSTTLISSRIGAQNNVGERITPA